jgi:hypothetical protein
MNPTTSVARRGLAALALTCAAIAIPSTALAASASPAKPARPATVAVLPRCGTGALTAWLGIPGDGYAGGAYYQL